MHEDYEDVRIEEWEKGNNPYSDSKSSEGILYGAALVVSQKIPGLTYDQARLLGLRGLEVFLGLFWDQLDVRKRRILVLMARGPAFSWNQDAPPEGW